jgi:hypothetical protein
MMSNIVLTTDNQDLQARVSTNAGSTYDATGIYASTVFRSSAAGSASGGEHPTAPVNQWTLDKGDSMDNSANYGLSGTLTFTNPLSTSVYTMVTGDFHYLSNNTQLIRDMVGFVWIATTAVNSFKLFASAAGTIASGTVRIYGFLK